MNVASGPEEERKDEEISTAKKVLSMQERQRDRKNVRADGGREIDSDKQLHCPKTYYRFGKNHGKQVLRI